MPTSWWRVWLHVQLGRMWIYYWQNRSDDSDLLAARIRPSVEGEGTPSQRAEFFIQRALSHLRRDRYVASDAAIAYAAKVREALRHVEDLAELPHLSFVVGFTHLWRNELDAAERGLSESLRQAERVGDAVVELRCHTYLGLVARKRGAVEEARAIFRRVLNMASAARMTEYIALATAGLAWAAWRDGHTSEAEAGAREALEAWHAMPVPYSFDWMAAWTLVAASLARNDLAEAIRHAEPMLSRDQQPLPERLAQLTTAAIEAWKNDDTGRTAAHLEEATRVAAATGHL
jgi:tetratricopeptide (TPR) repeat protein